MSRLRRPGATQCGSCRDITAYDELYEVKVAGYKAPRLLCADCFDRLTRLGIVK